MISTLFSSPRRSMFNEKTWIHAIVLFFTLPVLCSSFTEAKAQERMASQTPLPSPTSLPLSESPPLEISSNPALISIFGVRGTIVTRRILLTPNSSLKGLKIIPLDLNRSDDQAVIPATAVKIEVPSDQINANDAIVVPFILDLNHVRSGEYKGEARMQFNGGKAAIPIMVKVKDPWLLPLIVLGIGIVLSMIVTRYREQGKPRDETLVRIGRLRAQMNIDPDLDINFRSRVEALLIDVYTALNAEKWDDARRTIETAEAVLNRWRKGRDDWRAQLGYLHELDDRLNEFGEPTDLPSFLITLRRGIEDAGRTSPDMVGPDELRGKLDSLAQQLNRYASLKNRLETLVSLSNDLENRQKEWIAKSKRWRYQLDNLSPADAGAYNALLNEVEAGISAVEELIEQQPPSGAASKGGLSFGDLTLFNPLSPAPSARSLKADPIENAGNRLKWFKGVTFALAVLLLAGAGFGELYVANPTFGANRWGDYFTMLAWGFGAEATRAAVTGLMKNWGLPDAK